MPPRLNLLTDKLIELTSIFIEPMKRFHRFATGWKLVDDGNIQVTVNRHCKGSRNRRSGHHKHMRRMFVFGPQFGTLRYPKPMLLVNNHKTQIAKLHHIFYQCMCSDQNIDITRQQIGVNFFPFLRSGRSGKQCHLHIHIGQKLRKRSEMLQSQNFGGSHQTRLKSIIDGNQHAQQRYKRFSASNIALQQSIHLFAGSRILANFLNHLFLGIRQREREMLFVKCVEMFSHFSENKSIKLRLAVDSIAHNIQLDIKQLLEFETVFGIAQKNGIFGEMYIFYRIVIRHQMSRLQNIRRKRLGKTIVNHRKGISHDLVNRF
ncbi:MAG: hypothetical protein BWZ06_01832 [Bacteroidetes bacterium ADurb.BinA261]|nr:MAG: hypothetical protein BWZ06_01832 [Bacteroidetes bacterium ADurb.BinA261]